MSNADLQYLYSSCVNENKAQYYGVYSTVLSNEPDISNEDSRRKMYDDLMAWKGREHKSLLVKG